MSADKKRIEGVYTYHTNEMTVYAMSGTPIHYKNIVNVELIDNLRLVIKYDLDGAYRTAVFYKADYMGVEFKGAKVPTWEPWEDYWRRVDEEEGNNE